MNCQMWVIFDPYFLRPKIGHGRKKQ